MSTSRSKVVDDLKFIDDAIRARAQSLESKQVLTAAEVRELIADMDAFATLVRAAIIRTIEAESAGREG